MIQTQTPVVDGAEAMLGAHVLQYGPAVGQICSCGYVHGRVPGDERSQQEKHRRHVAEVISPPIFNEGWRRGLGHLAQNMATGLSPSVEKSLKEGAYWVRLGRDQARTILRLVGRAGEDQGAAVSRVNLREK